MPIQTHPVALLERTRCFVVVWFVVVVVIGQRCRPAFCASLRASLFGRCVVFGDHAIAISSSANFRVIRNSLAQPPFA